MGASHLIVTFVYRLAQWIVPPVVRVYFRLRVHGRENVPRTGGLLIASNHVSYLDPVIIGSATKRDLHFLARATLFRFPVFGWLIRNLQSIPLAQGGGDRAALRLAREAVQAGAAMVIFPEGTRSVDGALGNPQPGVGMLALQSGVSVIPVHIEGAFRAMPRGTRFPRPRRITVRWGEAKTAEEWLALTPADGERPARALSAILLQEIASLGGHQPSCRQNGCPPLGSDESEAMIRKPSRGSAPNLIDQDQTQPFHPPTKSGEQIP